METEIEHERMEHAPQEEDPQVDARKNSEGYFDMTAYKAVEKATPAESERFHKLLHTLFHLCELAGFEMIGRVTVRDRRTNRIWK